MHRSRQWCVRVLQAIMWHVRKQQLVDNRVTFAYNTTYLALSIPQIGQYGLKLNVIGVYIAACTPSTGCYNNTYCNSPTSSTGKCTSNGLAVGQAGSLEQQGKCECTSSFTYNTTMNSALNMYIFSWRHSIHLCKVVNPRLALNARQTRTALAHWAP